MFLLSLGYVWSATLNIFSPNFTIQFNCIAVHFIYTFPNKMDVTYGQMDGQADL